MPLHESQPVKVTLTVEVDGHALTWTHIAQAVGARYHGADPREQGYSTSETFESAVRTAAVRAIEAAEVDARRDIFRLYPVVEV